MSNLKQARGLLQHRISMQHFDLTRITPSEDVGVFIENYWLIEWDLRNKPSYTQHNLPHPSQHLVVDPHQNTGIFGLSSGKFTYTLEGTGRIFGVKFWPGAFRCFYGKPVSELSNRRISISEVFSTDDNELEAQLIRCTDTSNFGVNVESFIRKNNAQLDEQAVLARDVVAYIESNNQLMSVAQLAEYFDLSMRALQRLFDNYIGASPKWVIDRYRMIEAVEILNNNLPVNLTVLAHQLGYFDQAHFSNAFTALIGYPPSRYDS